MRHSTLTDQVVVITGANGGFGQALATALAAKGARLALIARRADVAKSLAASHGDTSRAAGFAADVQSLDQLEEAMHAIRRHFGRIDVVVANAGIHQVQPVEHQAEDDFARLIDINLTGVWRTHKAAIPHMRRGGYLLTVSSMAAFVHSPLHGAYSASKAGVLAMGNSLRLELRGRGIKVGSVHPTFFDTPLMDEVKADPAGQALWGGNSSGLWRMVPIDQVVDQTVRAIERRKQMVVVPGRLRAVAAAPNAWKHVVGRIGFTDRGIARAIALAEAVTR